MKKVFKCDLKRKTGRIMYFINLTYVFPLSKLSVVPFKSGEMCLPGSDVCVPALLGMEYPDPMGSDLSVPVLGCQIDPVSGNTLPLAGTMGDPNGKGTIIK